MTMEEEKVKKTQEFVRPRLNLWQDLKDGVRFLMWDPRANLVLGPLLITAESVALKSIIKYVPYTEIDYKAYMEQIEQIRAGEKRYSQIEGGTGPLVYPGGHVLLYKAMHWLTEGMEHVNRGQQAFRWLYLITLALQMLLYYELRIPGWCSVLACASKRLHSIYVLRLFNDCFTTFFMVITVLLLHYATRKRIWALCGSLTYSMAVSVKMNALLYAPAIAVSVYMLQDGQLTSCIMCGLLFCFWQLVVAWPFSGHLGEYFSTAFDFHRHFMYKWTINWQFLEPEAFDNQWFHRTLLISQLVATLTLLLCLYPQLPNYIYNSLKRPQECVLPPNHGNVILLLPLTNFIGIIFSRSLHYQFLCWYHWTIPLLLHDAMPAYLGIPWYVLHEWCWNSYPPNATASSLLLFLNCSLLLGVIFQVAQREHNAKPVEKTL